MVQVKVRVRGTIGVRLGLGYTACAHLGRPSWKEVRSCWMLLTLLRARHTPISARVLRQIERAQAAMEIPKRTMDARP